MIELSFPPLKNKSWFSGFLPAPTTTHKSPDFYIYNRKPTNADAIKAGRLKITPEEFVRRDDIVHRAYVAECYRVGEIIYPKTAANYAKYGAMRIQGVYQTYYSFGEDDEWPQNDCPMILTIISVNDKDKNGVILATHDWITRRNPVC